MHRDIKSANILITVKGQVRITDFGLAKLAGRTQLTKEGTSMGTVAYMSPEQTQGIEVDHRTDIWAFLEKLGADGMGVVYKAEDTKLKRDVAIKFLPRHIAASAEEHARFKSRRRPPRPC